MSNDNTYYEVGAFKKRPLEPWVSEETIVNLVFYIMVTVAALVLYIPVYFLVCHTNTVFRCDVANNHPEWHTTQVDETESSRLLVLSFKGTNKKTLVYCHTEQACWKLQDIQLTYPFVVITPTP